ncbi:tRNA (adenine(22)-N(1))-methyltransferase [Sporofaciens sp. SGI.106]|uniref:tRNA (adenine(22)-N(1))-methyltransferase n=1 Tax=Sporofaciens sp. SGI.106 TaxID=3420568 RepID=UPI003D074FD4
MELSKRLHAVAGLVTEGASVADIGTDHGYIPIYLIENGVAGKVIAMDINEGPLERAREHIEEHGLAQQIETRLSDGLEALKTGEADTVITAGMGGGLVIHILEARPEITKDVKYFILQPQSEIAKVRRFLNENGFISIAEDMVEEDGKYYPMMKMAHGTEERYSEIELLYGRRLLRERHSVLHRYLLRELKLKEEISEKLKLQKGDRIRIRLAELERDQVLLRKALACFDV